MRLIFSTLLHNPEVSSYFIMVMMDTLLKGKYVLFIVAINLFLMKEYLAATVNSELQLTSSEKLKLDKFKEMVTSKLPQDWMKQDIQLIRWLRAKNFDVRKATALLNQHLQWRNDYSIDTIHTEDWSDFEKDYPVFTDGVDIEGRPICALDFGEWDVRKAVLSGKMPRLQRWLNKCRDLAVVKVRQLQEQGKNVTQFNFLSNLDKVNLNQHLCVPCMSLYTDFSSVYESHYPGTANKIILINSPQIFEVALSLVRPIIAPSTRAALQVFGKNKADWEPVLFKEIAKDQLPPQFGGTRVYN